MATKKKKLRAPERTTRGRRTSKKKTAGKKRTSEKKPAKKKSAKKKATTRSAAKATVSKAARTPRKKVSRKGQADSSLAFHQGRSMRSGQQSGDLQGLSRSAGPDSESVDELLEEGNAFEADVVQGVEDAGDAEEREVRTHEVPEDDVPDEYLDKD